MSDDAPETPPPAPPKPPRSSKLLPILMILNLGGTGAAVFFQLKPRPALAVAAHADTEEAEKKKKEEEEKKPGPVLALDPFIVNLNEEGSSRYLKASFEVEVIDEPAKKSLELNKRVVRDDVLRYLSGLGVVDTQGEAGKSKIQAEVQARVDKALGGEKVKHVFFTDFVVQ
jgi:flagellar FliL protein